jgi:probable HAF family extracellular repeat protein
MVLGGLIAGLACSAQSQNYTVTRVATPMTGDSAAGALNGAGNVAGRSGTLFSTQTRAFFSRSATQFEVLGVLSGGDYSGASGINDLDEIVGTSNTATSIRGFFWNPSEGMRTLGTLPGDNVSRAFAVNNNGQAVGYSGGSGGNRAALWSRTGAIQDLGTLPGGDSSMAYGVSQSGYVVGQSGSSSGVRGFVWTEATGMTSVGVLPGNIASCAFAVNNVGTVVGYAGNAHGNSAFQWTAAGGIVALPTLSGGGVSRALAINNAGLIVGFSTKGEHDPRAVVWTLSGNIQDLNNLVPASAGVVLTEAHAINDRGQILARGYLQSDIGEQGHHVEHPGRVFLLTPYPGSRGSGHP